MTRSGYGFIDFDTPEHAAAAMSVMQGKPAGKYGTFFRLNWAGRSSASSLPAMFPSGAAPGAMGGGMLGRGGAPGWDRPAPPPAPSLGTLTEFVAFICE